MENKPDRQLSRQLQILAHLECIQKHTSQMRSNLIDEMTEADMNSKRKEDDK